MSNFRDILKPTEHFSGDLRALSQLLSSCIKSSNVDSTCFVTVSSRASEGDTEKKQGAHHVNVEQAEVTMIPDRPDRPGDSQASDSDSDGPILYRDEEEEEEDEDEFTTSMGLACFFFYNTESYNI